MYARITATNYLDSSSVSLIGNGAIILTYPDEPLNLVLNDEIVWGTNVGMSWDEGASNGGTPVLDYTIMSKNSLTQTYEERLIGLVGTSATISDL